MLLIDEVDRADDGFEAFLLELHAEATVTIPELGTERALYPPIVVLTSNRTRDLHDALKRRCLYHWIDYPGLTRIVEITRRRVPDSRADLAEQIGGPTCGFVRSMSRASWCRRGDRLGRGLPSTRDHDADPGDHLADAGLGAEVPRGPGPSHRARTGLGRYPRCPARFVAGSPSDGVGDSAHRWVVLLADVSGSMEGYGRAYLHLLHGAVRATGAEVFVFATRLHRLTQALAATQPELMLSRARAATTDWSGGIRIGLALQRFNDGWACRGLAPGPSW